MIKNIDFAKFLTENVQGAGYIRKILKVEELEEQPDDHRYGTISESHYYPEGERASVPCRQGDIFVISTIRQEPNFGLYQFTYYLVQVDFELAGDLRVIDCASRIGGYDAASFPRPEHIFVEEILTRGLLKPGQAQDDGLDVKKPEAVSRKTCPFCKTEHEQKGWLNIICPCGAKYYSNEKFWLERKTGKKEHDMDEN